VPHRLPNRALAVLQPLKVLEPVLSCGGMQAHKAHVRNGQVVFDEPAELPEGAELYVVVNDRGEELDDEDRAELNAMLEESLEEMRQGKTLDGESFLAGLGHRIT
jgi:hypothetical protein